MHAFGEIGQENICRSGGNYYMYIHGCTTTHKIHLKKYTFELTLISFYILYTNNSLTCTNVSLQCATMCCRVKHSLDACCSRVSGTSVCASLICFNRCIAEQYDIYCTLQDVQQCVKSQNMLRVLAGDQNTAWLGILCRTLLVFI